MEIAQERDGDAVILKLSGRLDSSTANAAGEAIAAALAGAAGSPRLVVDMTGLTYVSSGGLRVLLAAAKRIKEAGGRLALFGLAPGVREVFSISGFDTIFSIHSGRSAALAAVR